MKGMSQFYYFIICFFFIQVGWQVRIPAPAFTIDAVSK